MLAVLLFHSCACSNKYICIPTYIYGYMKFLYNNKKLDYLGILMNIVDFKKYL